MTFLFHFIYGIIPTPLTFIFFRGVGQPPTSYGKPQILQATAPHGRRRALKGTVIDAPRDLEPDPHRPGLQSLMVSMMNLWLI